MRPGISAAPQLTLVSTTTRSPLSPVMHRYDPFGSHLYIRPHRAIRAIRESSRLSTFGGGGYLNRCCIYSDSKNCFNVWQVRLVECITSHINFQYSCTYY